ncbi:MAG: peptidase M20, partial [bacterium]
MSKYPSLIEMFLELIRIDSESFSERNVADYVIGKLKPYVDTLVEDDAGVMLNCNSGNLIATI